MCKFYAKVKFGSEEDSQELISAFFQNFNAESSIKVREKEAELVIVFQKPPMPIIEAINNCKIIDLNCNYQELIEKKEEIDSDGVVKAENLEQIDDRIAKVEDSKQNEQKEVMRIAELEEISKKATSFENFVKLVAEWINIERNQELFIKIVVEYVEFDHISWKRAVELTLLGNKCYTFFDANEIRQKISKKLKNCSITLMAFLNMLKQYYSYPFKREEEKSDGKIAENIQVKKRMKCMPEIKEFEEKLSNLDKIQSIDEKICYVLGAMGLNNVSEDEKKQIVEIATTAVKKERMDLDSFLIETDIPFEQKKARMMFSKFVNDFVQKYESNKQVKLLDFLLDLQKLIMIESESVSK